MALVTLENLKVYANQAGDTFEANQETILSDLIDKVGKMFDSYVGQAVEATAYTEYYDGNGSDTIRLLHYPVNSITSITEDISRAFDGDAMDSDLYFLDSPYICLKSSSFITGKRVYKIVYNAGYSTVPEDIKHACINEIMRIYKLRYMNGDYGVSSKGRPEGGNDSYISDALLSDTKLVLDRYYAGQIF